ncbi:MAG: DUF1906 domain-containing protein [Myxococcaceae bacterium]|nr:DUF1906 domain-containing protein [Myxococcaceae bacterium]
MLTALVAVAVAAAPARAEQSADGRGLIQEMRRLSSQEGWARTGAALLLTRNGGASWGDITPSRGLEGVSGAWFIDAAQGWLVGVDPLAPGQLFVLETADGGRSWNEQLVPTSVLEKDSVYARAQVHFLDAQRGWLLGKVATSAAFSVGELLRTEDGGKTWQRLPAPPAAGRIVFIDGERGFMVGAPVAEKLYATEDGGKSWRELSLTPGYVLHDLPAFRTPREGFVAVTIPGEKPRVETFTTRDGGRSWQEDASIALPAGDYTDAAIAALSESGQLVALAVNNSVLAPSSLESPLSLTGALGPASIQALSFTGAQGWALVAEGACDERSCQQASRVVELDTGARLAAARDVLARSFSEPREAGGVAPLASTTSFDKGFDKCAAATSSQMQAWKTSSPYKDANIYFGGSARACAQPNLTSSWVSTVFSQGWRLIPTWVGPQSPCSGYSNKFSYDVATARTQGLNEASAAVSAAQALGLGSNTPLYYDMENYNETDTACNAAVRAFVNAWAERVKANGYIAGVYGNAWDVQKDMSPAAISLPPDAVWIASWACAANTTSCGWTPTVWGISGLSDSYWTNNQRIRQYWGAHNETFGGVQFNIDSNYANAPVATSGGGTGGSFTCDDGDSCFTLYGPSQYWHRETACGGSSVGTGGDLYWTYVNGSTTSNYARWKPNFSGTGGAGSYSVAVFIPRCFGTTQQAKYRVYHNGVTDTVTVNQNNAYDQWVTLGSFYFNNNGTEYVELADSTGESATSYLQISFDAVRFSR